MKRLFASPNRRDEVLEMNTTLDASERRKVQHLGFPEIFFVSAETKTHQKLDFSCHTRHIIFVRVLPGCNNVEAFIR